MARVNTVQVLNRLDREAERAMRSALRKVAPESSITSSRLAVVFMRELKRIANSSMYVPDSSVSG